MSMKRTILTLCSLAAAGIASTVVVAGDYKIDPNHTYPSFEADHFGGLSIWRGKIDRTSGTISYDKIKKSGTVSVIMDMNSVDFGHDKMNEKARSDEIFDTARFPQASYNGTMSDFTDDGTPTKVRGKLTLHGVTQPLDLTINQFKCVNHPMYKKEVCGADAKATFNRDDFGVDAGKKYGFLMKVDLLIQVEALQADK